MVVYKNYIYSVVIKIMVLKKKMLKQIHFFL